jgi:spermidine/putrescine transport system ATP-binding protein
MLRLLRRKNTYDQEEALSMSDRIAVMNEGRIDQIGTPQEVYETPTTVFVANFLGVANLMTGEAVGRAADGCELRVDDFRLRACAGDVTVGGEAMVVVRPERVEIRPPPIRSRTAFPEWSIAPSTSGRTSGCWCAWRPARWSRRRSPTPAGWCPIRRGDPVLVHLPQDALRLLAASNGAVIAAPKTAEAPGG